MGLHFSRVNKYIEHEPLILVQTGTAHAEPLLVPLPPHSNSRFMTNLLTKQPQQILPAKTDFTAPIKISTRATDSLARSNSEMLRPLPALNPELSTRGEKGSSNQGGSRMSGFGSSSLSKMQLNNDVEVY
jgi:hypothetical protein